MPVLPTSISYKLQADILGGQLNALSSASARYLQCLETFSKENADELSAEDLAELRQKQTSYVTLLRIYATKWNAMVGEYRAKQSPPAK